MANKIYQGERIAIAGQLKDNNVVTTAYTLICRIFSSWGVALRDIPLVVDTQTQSYSCSVDTTDLEGEVRFRFIASISQGEIIVNNEDIVKEILL